MCWVSLLAIWDAPRIVSPPRHPAVEPAAGAIACQQELGRLNRKEAVRVVIDMEKRTSPHARTGGSG